MNLWNIKDLPVPPINTYKANNKRIDIKHLHDVFEEGRQFFDYNKFMYAEYTVLSRIVYRMKQKFRSAKDFKALEKINKALDNYFKMDMSQVLKSFMQLIPSRYKDETYLPTKNHLDYILVRLQGVVKLMERIVETSKIAAYLLDKRMHIGHFWKIAFITFSIVSRIYILAKYTAKFICEFYSKLYPFSSKLKNTSKWLVHYTFPKDLKEWMNVDWLELDDEIQIIETPTEMPDIIKFFDLVEDDDEVQFCDEYVMIKDDEMETEEKLKKISSTNFKNLWELRGFDVGEDVGEIIEINDTLDEESFLRDKNYTREKNSKRNILHDLEKDDDLAILDNSLYLENDTSDSDTDVTNFLLQQEDSKMFAVTEEQSTLTIPDSPLEDTNKKKKIRITKLKLGENIIVPSSDISNLSLLQKKPKIYPKREDESIITIPDTSLEERSENNNNVFIKMDEESFITIPESPSLDRKEKKMPELRLEENGCSSARNRYPNNENPELFTKTGEETIITIPDTPLIDGKEKIKLIMELKNKENEEGIIVSGGGNFNMFTKSKEEIITIPDTPLVNRKRKRKTVTKLDIEENGGKVTKHTNFDTFNKNDEDNIVTISDTSLMTIKDEKLVKKEKKIKKPKQIGSIYVKSLSELAPNLLRNEDTLQHNSSIKMNDTGEKTVNKNLVKMKKKKTKHNQKDRKSVQNILNLLENKNKLEPIISSPRKTTKISDTYFMDATKTYDGDRTSSSTSKNNNEQNYDFQTDFNDKINSNRSVTVVKRAKQSKKKKCSILAKKDSLSDKSNKFSNKKIKLPKTRKKKNKIPMEQSSDLNNKHPNKKTKSPKTQKKKNKIPMEQRANLHNTGLHNDGVPGTSANGSKKRKIKAAGEVQKIKKSLLEIDRQRRLLKMKLCKAKQNLNRNKVSGELSSGKKVEQKFVQVHRANEPNANKSTKLSKKNYFLMKQKKRREKRKQKRKLKTAELGSNKTDTPKTSKKLKNNKSNQIQQNIKLKSISNKSTKQNLKTS